MPGAYAERRKRVERDAAARRQWLTFVIAGGGFAGAETAGAVNDFVRETAKFYPRLGDEQVRVVVIRFAVR
jgi:NADH dehydrogenase